MTINGIDGSSQLIDRAKKLGRIIAQHEVDLQPMDLEDSVRRSAALVAAGFPEKSVDLSVRTTPRASVVAADDMLDEVFTNLLSNAVKYTDAKHVPIDVDVEEADGHENHGKLVKVSISDHGRGIPESMKDTVFARYLKTAHGTGLGLSIVYALVVERYSGKIRISNRMEDDYTKGTKVELWLPRPT
jgi:signal transduction histidine kinase